MLKKQKVFYGWWVLFALFIIGMLGPMGRYGIVAFSPLITSELGWSRTVFGAGLSITIWAYAGLVLISGWMVDRIGARKTILLGGVFSFAGWILLSTMWLPWHLYLYYGLIMAFAVSLTHFVPIQATANKWFRRKAGLVTGITTVSVSLGMAVFVPALTVMSSSLGWRTTSIISGFAFGLCIILLAFCVIRDTPESMGLLPDGEISPLAGDRLPVDSEESWSIKEVLRTSKFWLIFIAFSLPGVAIQGLLSHLVVWAVDLGSNMTVAGAFITAMLIPSIPAKIGGGWFGDRYGKKGIIIFSDLACCIMMFWGWYGVSNPRYLAMFAIIMGLSYGLTSGLFAPYLGDLFGRTYIGSLYALISMGYGILGGSGPLIWGMIFDASGGYGQACLVSAGCYAVAVIAIRFLPAV